MKVFWLTKYTEEMEHPLYRSVKEPENIVSKNIEEENSFNLLIITNPKDSFFIYNIDYMYFHTDESIIVKLYASNDFPLINESLTGDLLDLRFLNNTLDESTVTQLCTITNSSSLLKDKYIILIPGGSIILRVDKPILRAKLDINYTVESL